MAKVLAHVWLIIAYKHWYEYPSAAQTAEHEQQSQGQTLAISIFDDSWSNGMVEER